MAKRIHFLSDVGELESGHLRCQRCGVVGDRQRLFEHREGIMTECLRNRVLDWIDRRWPR